MSAIVTDQFRILNAKNFIDSVQSSSNSYYVYVGLPNANQVGFGRTTTWNTDPPSPIDNIQYQGQISDTMMFGKKITSANVRQSIRRIDWVRGTRYEMYRHDYSLKNPSPITNSARLYDSNYYVINSEYRVYICISNGSSGINTTGNVSQDEPLFTDLEPSKAGESGDGYIWKYLFTVSPSDIIKFDTTEYISLPSNWSTSTDTQIQAIREAADSEINQNQIKMVYIDKQGSNYQSGLAQECNILGDGSGAKVLVDVIGGKITKTTVSSGGSGYTYGIVDLGSINLSAQSTPAKLIPIIPPSKGHGYDIYKELGADRALVYARFDDSTKDFPIDTKFSQVGVLKNPTSIGSTVLYTDSQFSSLYGFKFSSITGAPVIGEKITQIVTDPDNNTTSKAVGYVASYDSETMVLKYFRDRSLYYNQTTLDETDYVGISTLSKVLKFESSSNPITGQQSGFSGSIHTGFTGVSTNPTGNKVINLATSFTNGLASPEINKSSGELIYLDNRPQISRNSRQKEDIKIILEF
jgi:hypothetical protein